MFAKGEIGIPPTAVTIPIGPTTTTSFPQGQFPSWSSCQCEAGSIRASFRMLETAPILFFRAAQLGSSSRVVACGYPCKNVLPWLHLERRHRLAGLGHLTFHQKTQVRILLPPLVPCCSKRIAFGLIPQGRPAPAVRGASVQTSFLPA